MKLYRVVREVVSEAVAVVRLGEIPVIKETARQFEVERCKAGEWSAVVRKSNMVRHGFAATPEEAIRIAVNQALTKVAKAQHQVELAEALVTEVRELKKRVQMLEGNDK